MEIQNKGRETADRRKKLKDLLPYCRVSTDAKNRKIHLGKPDQAL